MDAKRAASFTSTVALGHPFWPNLSYVCTCTTRQRDISAVSKCSLVGSHYQEVLPNATMTSRSI